MRRKLFVPLIAFAIVAAFSTSCQKDAIISEPEQKSFSPIAVANMNEAYEKAGMYNDTLAECSHSHSMTHDSPHAGLAAHYDEMFHHYDSVFTAMHHHHCQNEDVNCCSNDSMNMNGMMGNSNMDTTSGSGGMSGNGSMGGSSGSMGSSGSGSGMGGGGMNGSYSGGMMGSGSGMGGNNGSGMDSSGTGSGGMMNGGMTGNNMMNSNQSMSGCMHMNCSGHMAAMDSLRTLHQQYCPR